MAFKSWQSCKLEPGQVKSNQVTVQLANSKLLVTNSSSRVPEKKWTFWKSQTRAYKWTNSSLAQTESNQVLKNIQTRAYVYKPQVYFNPRVFQVFRSKWTRAYLYKPPVCVWPRAFIVLYLSKLETKLQVWTSNLRFALETSGLDWKPPVCVLGTKTDFWHE